MINLWEIRTETGSWYYIRQTLTGWAAMAGRFNKVRPSSQLMMSHRWYSIEPPLEYWPPRIGQPLLFLSTSFWNRMDPDRIPGGGKYTSCIVEVIFTPSGGSDVEDQHGNTQQDCEGHPCASRGPSEDGAFGR